MSRGELLFTCGLPRSGKSLWCNAWVSTSSSHPRRVIICGDDFRNALYGRSFQIEAEGTVFAMMDVATRALLNRGFDVVIDETCTTEQTLLRYLRIDINAQPVWINASKELCIERAIADGKPYLVGPIERMAAQLHYLKSNWDKIHADALKYLAERKAQDVAV